MAVAYRSSQSVTNGTAGTSVTVSKPAGIVDTGSNPGRDHLLAFIAATGAPTFTPPAGWTLVTSAVDAGNTVTLKVYEKLASSEGASWTWTLGTSQRNIGWVGAYTGVDPTTPIVTDAGDYGADLTLTSSTTLDVDDTLQPAMGVVPVAVAVRTASGAATTWTLTNAFLVAKTERLDTSTNGGAGTDISAVVGDDPWSGNYEVTGSYQMIASQNQSAGVALLICLSPYFAPYGGGVGDAGIVVEAAFGVDPDGDSSVWTWTDLTSFVHNPAKLVLDHGRANATSIADPSAMRFTLLNLNGEFTNPAGAYWQYMVRNLPFRVRLTGFGVGSTLGYHRGTAFLASMRPRWDASANFAVVEIVAQGRLRRLQQRTDALRSPAFRWFSGRTPTLAVDPAAYWSFEDGSDASSAASGLAGQDPIPVTGFTFAADSSIVGTSPLPTIATGASFVAPVPAYTPTTQWAVMFAMNIAAEPAATTTLMEFSSSGTAASWRIELAPGASALHLRAFDSTGASLLDVSSSVTEADYYGFPFVYALAVEQNGTAVDYNFSITTVALSGGSYSGSSGGVTGSVASQTIGAILNAKLNAAVGIDGATFGHLTVYTDPDFSSVFEPTLAAKALLIGNATDTPWARFSLLVQEEAVPATWDASDNSDLTMGPQGIATLMSFIRECEVVEGCVVNDSGDTFGETGLLWFPARDDRENVDATMTLDIDSGHVAPGFEPALDDQDTRNDVEVSRSGGSSAIVTDEASIALEGRVREQVVVNTVNDAFLSQIAGWRVNLGTVTGMRFPTVGWNMRRATDLAQQWMACRLNHRIDITNPPSQYPPDDIRTILEGYTETLASDEWTVRANLSSFDPYRIFTLAQIGADAGEFTGRLIGDPLCALRTAVDSDDTSLVFDPNAMRWIVLYKSDTFSRTESNAWTGWTIVDGAASAFSVNGSVGIMRHSSIANLSVTYDTGQADHDATIYFRIPVAPTGGSAAAIVVIRPRWTDANNHYEARTTTDAAGNMVFVIRSRVGGSGAVLATGTTLTLNTSHTYGLRIRAFGSSLRAKFWDSTTTAQPDWQISATDTNLATGNTVQILCIPSSVTNTLPFDFYFDDAAITAPGADPDDFPIDIRIGGELVTASSISTTAATFVGVGTVAHANNASVTPTIHASSATNDLMLIFAAIRNSGAGVPDTPSGWTRLPVFLAADNCQLFAKVHDGSESDPTVTFTGGVANADTSAQIITLRGTPTTLTDLADVVVATSASQLNGSAQNINYPGLHPHRDGCIVLALGWKQDDWTSVATLSGFTEIGEPDTTTGNDQGIVWDYAIQTTATAVLPGSFVVTGGASAISRAALVAIAGGYQTATVTRSVNGVVKSHAIGTRIEADDPCVMGL